MSDLAPRLGSPAAGVVVTGGASGLGLAAAQALAAVGRPVALWDINAEGARTAAQEIAVAHGVATLGLAVDLRDPDAIGPAAARTREAIGTVGGILHCAGTAETTYIDGVTPGNWDVGLALHARAVILLVQAFRDDLRMTPGAAIVATASIAATLGHARTPIYTAAKGAVIALVKSMADDLAADGVRINALSPGVIDTPMGRAMSAEARADFERRILLGRFGEPEEIGRMARFLLSDEASYITGMEIVVDGGLTCSMRIEDGDSRARQDR